MPSLVEDVRLPVHLLTIVAMGVDLFDNQDLEALAETAASLNRWEFTLVAGPAGGGKRHGVAGQRAGDLLSRDVLSTPVFSPSP